MFISLFGYCAREGGLVDNLLMQLFTLGSSKIEVFETYFIDTVITQNDHPRYVPCSASPPQRIYPEQHTPKTG